MTNVKKMYEELNQMLEDNKSKKVSTILPMLQELMAKKKNLSGQDKTFAKDDEGNTICVFCYYHKRWELVDVCAYGAKASSASGLNTMCKEGVSKWTKQQRVRSQEESNILVQLSQELLQVSDIGQAKKDIASRAKVIVARDDEHGFDTLEEAIASI